MLAGSLLHELHRRPVGDPLAELVPARVLLSGKVWAVEELLQAEDADALLARLVDQRKVLRDHSFADLGEAGLVGRQDVARLDETAAHDS